MKNIKTLSSNMRLAALSLAILVTFVNPYNINASCIEPGNPEEELETSDAVFTGSVVYISSANGIWMDGVTRTLISLGFRPADVYGNFSYGRKIVFEVDKSWKGVTTSSVTIRTGYSTANSSGYPFELGDYYLVYASHAYGDPEKYLLTSLCTRTQVSPNNSEDIAYLKNIPTLKLSYFPAITRTIDNSLFLIIVFLMGFIYILHRRKK
jgi:hypothetical protein